MKKLLSLTLALAMLLALAAGCVPSDQEVGTSPEVTQSQSDTQSPAPGGEVTATPDAGPKEINYARAYDATTLDPHMAQDDGSYDILYLTGEGLVRERNGEIVPGIAESWEVSDDGLEFTFHLRQSTWSDGTPLTAYDFEYSFFRIIEPANATQNASQAYTLFKNAGAYNAGEITDRSQVGIKAVDDYTLKITCEEPSIETLNTLARFVWLPLKQSVAEAAGVGYGSDKDKFLGNGPFKITEWERENYIVLEKNENYWDAANIKLDKITGKIGAQAETAVDMMLAGDLDYLTLTNYDQMSILKDAGFVVNNCTYGMTFLVFNVDGRTDETAKILENANFRLALNYCINRKAITDTLYTGSTPATRITSPNCAGVSKLFSEEYPYEAWPATGDPEKAKQHFGLALQELGMTADELPEFSMLCYDSQRNLTVMQAIQDMYLTTLGVKCVIDPQPIQQMMAKMFSGDYDLWWSSMPLGSLDWASPDSFMPNFDYRQPGYTSTYVNEKLIGFYAMASTTLDMKERKDLMFEMEKVLCEEDPPFAIVGWTQKYIITVPELTNVYIGTRDDLTYADLTN